MLGRDEWLAEGDRQIAVARTCEDFDTEEARRCRGRAKKMHARASHLQRQIDKLIEKSRIQTHSSVERKSLQTESKQSLAR
jgi:hypothetical protein